MNTGITRDEKGTYHWVGVIDSQYDGKVLWIIYGSTGGLCSVFLIMALVSFPGILRAVVLSCLAVLAVVSVITLPLMRASRGRKQKYEMNDEYVRYVGYGKEDAIFSYDKIRKVHVYNSRDMLEVKGLIVSAPFFVPHEYFGFVRDFILRRLPGDAEVTYE